MWWTRLKYQSIVVIWGIIHLISVNTFRPEASWPIPDSHVYIFGPDRGNCSSLQDWNGAWSRGDINDNAPHAVINSTSISLDHNWVLTCVKSLEDNYVFRDDDGSNQLCYRCLIIFERHHNVLQYRQSECNDEQQATFDDCATIPTSSPVHSLFRIGAKAEPCPFAERKMTFEYSRDDRTCPYLPPSGSFVETCSDAGTVRFNYEACHNVKGSEKFMEELTCLGSWQENSQNYFVGKVIRNVSGHNQEGFRCFNFNEVGASKTSRDVTGYQVARSGDGGSCAHANSPTDGAWTYKLTVQEEKYISFPYWLGPDPDENGESRWNALNLTFQFVINGAGGKIQVVPTHLDASQNMNVSAKKSYQFTAIKVDNLTATYAAIDVVEIAGCTHLPICMDVYKRDENVIEIELYHRTVETDKTTSCHHIAKVNPHITYTLVKDRPHPVSCPLTGVFKLDVPMLSDHEQHIEKCESKTNNTAAILENKNLDHFLEIGCGGRHLSTLDFYTSCRNGKPILPGEALQLVSGLDCISSWKENNTTFIVANNSRFGVPGYRCLELTQNLEDFTYSVFVSMNDCKPSSHQRLINWTFSATHFSECGYTKSKANMHVSSSSMLNGISVNIGLCLLLSIFSAFNCLRGMRIAGKLYTVYKVDC